jgi:hypothetical protein
MANPLTAEQKLLADQIHAKLVQASADDLRLLAELLAGKPYQELLGETEFQVRDIVHQIGAKALQTALNERKKGGTAGRAIAALTVATTANSSGGSQKRS